MKKKIIFLSLLSIICITLIIAPIFIFKDSPVCYSIINIGYNDVVFVDENYEVKYKEILQNNKKIKAYTELEEKIIQEIMAIDNLEKSKNVDVIFSNKGVSLRDNTINPKKLGEYEVSIYYYFEDKYEREAYCNIKLLDLYVTDKEYSNFEKIENANDFEKLNNNSDANYIISDDIDLTNVTKEYKLKGRLINPYGFKVKNYSYDVKESTNKGMYSSFITVENGGYVDNIITNNINYSIYSDNANVSFIYAAGGIVKNSLININVAYMNNYDNNPNLTLLSNKSGIYNSIDYVNTSIYFKINQGNNKININLEGDFINSNVNIDSDIDVSKYTASYFYRENSYISINKNVLDISHKYLNFDNFVNESNHLLVILNDEYTTNDLITNTNGVIGTYSLPFDVIAFDKLEDNNFLTGFDTVTNGYPCFRK